MSAPTRDESRRAWSPGRWAGGARGLWVRPGLISDRARRTVDLRYGPSVHNRLPFEPRSDHGRRPSRPRARRMGGHCQCGPEGGPRRRLRGDPGEASFDAEARLLPGMDRASLFGGRGRLVGTAGGVLLLAPVENVFTLMHVSGFYQDLVHGTVIVTAVAVSSRKD